jgi:hypothetical protein
LRLDRLRERVLRPGLDCARSCRATAYSGGLATPESVWDGKGDAIARCDFAPRILQYRKRRFAVTAGRGRRTSSLRRESDKRCAQALDFRVGRRERLQFENTKGAPGIPEKADETGPRLTGHLIAEYLFAAGHLQLGKLADEVLGVGRDAGLAVNHGRICIRNLRRKSAIRSAPWV